MKRANSKQKRKLEPFENRRDWIMFFGFAQMHVGRAGGPINDPHDEVLQLSIKRWMDDCEAWTVYRHQRGTKKDGKVVYRKWDSEADRARFRALGNKEAPKELRSNPTIIEKELAVPGAWVKELEGKVSSIQIPMIAGSNYPLERQMTSQLRVWRRNEEATYEWHSTPSKGWRTMTDMFNALLKSFREYLQGKPLAAL